MTKKATVIPKRPLLPAPPINRLALACGTALVVLTLAAYGRTFAVPALFDDDASIAENPTIHSLASSLFPPSYATVGGRPVLNVSFAINYAISANRVWSYHVVNLAIHVLSGLTLFGIMRRTLARRAAPAATWVAFSIAVLWALHPLQTESVTYLVQRAESLMGLFYLSTLYLFIRGTEAESRAPYAWYATAVATCLIGMATKEVMVSAPLTVLLYDRTFLSGTFAEAWRRRMPVYVGLGATWIILPFLVLSTHGRGGTAGYASGVSVLSYVLTEFPAIAHYLRLSFWPRPLVFDYGTALAPHSIAILPDALLVVALGAATLWALAKRPVVGFLGTCFFAILAPSSSIVPVASEPMAEHRMYLALIPVVTLAVLGIYRWLGRAALAFTLVLAGALLGATLDRNEAYASDERIWSDTVAKLPKNERAHNNLGDALDDEGRTDEAIAQYRMVIQLKPDSAEGHCNLGNGLAKIPGRMNEAVAEYEEAVRLKPEYEPAHKNLANALAAQGRTAEAIAQCEEALRLRPADAEAHSNLGGALTQAPGRLGEAIAECREALRLKPDLAQAHSNLGNALSMVPGRSDEAIGELERALRIKPADAKAHNNLANVLVKVPGRLDEAIAEYEETLRLEPDLPEAHNNLGNALDARGRTAEAVAQLREALRLRPDFSEAHSDLGNILAKTPGQLDEAIAQYEEALRLQPDNVFARINLGNALVRVPGRADEALAAYAEALRLRPDMAGIHLNMALTLLRIPGRDDEAKAHLQEALRLQPDNVVARQIMARIAPNPP